VAGAFNHVIHAVQERRNVDFASEGPMSAVMRRSGCQIHVMQRPEARSGSSDLALILGGCGVPGPGSLSPPAPRFAPPLPHYPHASPSRSAPPR